jgi:hypothetical protein
MAPQDTLKENYLQKNLHVAGIMLGSLSNSTKENGRFISIDK